MIRTRVWGPALLIVALTLTGCSAGGTTEPASDASNTAANEDEAVVEEADVEPEPVDMDCATFLASEQANADASSTIEEFDAAYFSLELFPMLPEPDCLILKTTSDDPGNVAGTAYYFNAPATFVADTSDMLATAGYTSSGEDTWTLDGDLGTTTAELGWDDGTDPTVEDAGGPFGFIRF